jgi:hypothetical protein
MLGMCKLGFGGKSAWSFSLTLNAALAGMVRIGHSLFDKLALTNGQTAVSCTSDLQRVKEASDGVLICERD